MRRLLAWLSLATLLAAAVPARAQTVITSTAPDHVSVTLYAAPNRSAGEPLDLDNAAGYALITETRTVTLPAGVAVIRFEGVAGNILPESALLSGLPDGVEEKNLDASLLSPRSLFDRALGRRVIVRRTDPGTGKVMLLQATLKSGVDGAAVLQFAGGDYGDLRCSGLPEMLVYDGIPPGLSARPTLSVRTISTKARTVTLTLSYLAGGFDWQADYIVAMKPDGRGADLFAWITLASSDVTSFPDADLQVVAGKINRAENDDDDDFGPGDDDLSLKCWPLPRYDLNAPPPPSPPAPAPMADSDGVGDIIVTANRARAMSMAAAVPIAVIATAEQLGDLKLYRFPRRVTVASNSQKQVGMLNKPSVKLWPVYRSWLSGDDASTVLLLRGKNVTANGLGVPLPGGRAAIFDTVRGRSMMVGESSIDDKTVGEEFDLVLGEPGAVNAEVETIREKDRTVRYQLTVTNANPWPIEYEGRFRLWNNRKVRNSSGKLGTKDGMPIWTVRIPANGSAVLSYTIVEPRDDDDD